MHKFTFTYYGWIPSYKDFDQDDYECSAKTMQDAWADFNKHVKFVKSAALTHIDGKPVKKDNLPKPTQEGKLSEALDPDETYAIEADGKNPNRIRYQYADNILTLIELDKFSGRRNAVNVSKKQLAQIIRKIK